MARDERNFETPKIKRKRREAKCTEQSRDISTANQCVVTHYCLKYERERGKIPYITVIKCHIV